jgi:hypothetical protein
MNDDTVLGHIVTKLDERRLELQDFVGEGGAKDFPDYKKLCGTIQGLVYAKEVITDLAKRLENDDDE